MNLIYSCSQQLVINFLVKDLISAFVNRYVTKVGQEYQILHIYVLLYYITVLYNI